MRAGITLLARLLLGASFVLAGTSKFLAPEGFVTAFDWVAPALGLAPSSLAVVRDVLPHVEIVVGLCLLAGLYLRASFLAAAALLAVFLGVLAVGSFSEGGIGECGCFGQSVLDDGGPVVVAIRNVALLLLAILGAVFRRPLLSVDGAVARRRAARAAPRAEFAAGAPRP